MRLIDADGHLEESPATSADDYLDPAHRSLRPKVVNVDGMIYWMLEEQLFPRRLGKGCHNLGTPASFSAPPAIRLKPRLSLIRQRPINELQTT